MEDKIIHKKKLRTAAEVADALVNHAKFQSEQMLIEANRQASLLVKEAEQSGLQEGHKKAFSSLISGESLLKETVEQAKYIILDIAVEIAKEIIMQELTVSPGLIQPRINFLINKVLNARRIKIYIHPSIEEEVNKLISTNFEDNRQIEVIPDANSELADIRVVTELGEIKTNLEQELQDTSLRLKANYSRILK